MVWAQSFIQIWAIFNFRFQRFFFGSVITMGSSMDGFLIQANTQEQKGEKKEEKDEEKGKKHEKRRNSR